MNNLKTKLVERLSYIDNLRIFLIIMVISHHAAQPYGPTGGDWPLFNEVRNAIFGPFFFINASFGMGLFFLVSGYFVPQSFKKKGVRLFIKSKLIRLGIPLVFMTLFLFAPLAYQSSNSDIPFLKYIFTKYIGDWQLEFGHMWFVFHLLVYSFGYAIIMILNHKLKLSGIRIGKVQTHFPIIVFIMFLALVTWIVRIWYPIDRWVKLFRTMPVEVAHLPQYVSLFAIGIFAGKNNWFSKIPSKFGFTWLIIGLLTSIAYAVSYLTEIRESISMAINNYYINLFFYCVWESFICIALCIGIITLFRERLNVSTNLLSVLAQNTYTVYIIHIIIVVSIQFSIAEATLSPLTKFGIVVFISVPICFAFSYLIRKIPGIRTVL